MISNESMHELVIWLREQFDKDDEIAHAACEGAKGKWRHVNPDRFEGLILGDHGAEVTFDEGYPTREQAAHIAEHDPARTLTEVDSKRRTVDTLQSEGGDRMFSDVFRLMALPYSERPGFREEWQP